MTAPHADDHTERLERFLLEERGPGDAELAAALDACAICRAEWAALRELMVDLDAAGREERAVLSASRDPRGASSAPRPHGLALAAALLLVAALGLGVLTARAFDEVYLGDGGAAIHPSGEVRAYDVFRWNLAPPPGGGFRLRVWNAELPAGLPAVDVRVDTNRWTPAPDVARDLPPHIRWQVVALDALGDPFESFERSARRSPR